MKKITTLIMLLFLVACGDEMPSLPKGYELVSADGHSYFVYITPEALGNKSEQRLVGKTVCVDMFKTPDYCEVWFWSNREEIPKKFPIINRKSIIGMYQMKGDKVKLKALTGIDGQATDDLKSINPNKFINTESIKTEDSEEYENPEN